jgi:small-conductance mechanosensitive channel
VFANSELSKGRLRNYATMTERRVAFNFGLRADTSVDDALAVATLLREIIAQVPTTRLDRVHWAAFTENALWFEAVYYVLDSNYNVYMDKQQSINAALLRGLRQRSIELAVGTPVRLMTPAPTTYPAAAS